MATLNKSLLLRHVHNRFSGESNPWSDWIRFWYEGGRAEADTPCWSHIKSLVAQYRSLTEVALGDGDTTSFWHDTWT